MSPYFTFFSALITVISLNFFPYSEITTVDNSSLMGIHTVDAADSLALVALYDSTSGTEWINQTNWKSTAPVSEWYGVTVSNGRVTELRLNNNGLNGTVPASFSNLTALKILNLNANKDTAKGILGIQGITSLDGMNALERIHINHNKLTSLPDFTSLTSLNRLECNYNDLTSLPDLTNLSSISFLECKKNDSLKSLPPSLSSLKTLTWLEVSDCGLQSLPSLDSLLLLERLAIHRNSLGSVQDLDHLTNLTYVNLEVTGITILPQLPSSLISLEISNNELTEINQVTNLLNLEVLNCGDNELDSLPSLLTQLTNLTSLSCDRNSIQSLPQLSSLTNLVSLRFNNNQIRSLPDLSQLDDLEVLYCNDNLLIELPPFSSSGKLRFINATRNDLVSLPSPTTLTGLTDLGVQNNHLEFGYLQPYVSVLDAEKFAYAPQDSVGLPSLIVAEPFTNIELYAQNGGTNTSYTWYKTGDLTPLSNADTLVFDPIQYEDSGSYYYRATNPEFPSLTLTSRLRTISTAEMGRKVDSLALIAFYNSTGGPQWENDSNWLTTAPLDDWHGVTLRNGRVTQLSLSENNLTDTIPEEINTLTELIMLDLPINNISSIPDLSGLTQLEILTCQSNNLSALPPIATDSLQTLDVSNNRLGFESLEPFAFMRNDANYNFTYSPQKKVDPEQFITAYIDSSAVLATAVKGVNSQYQWFFNDTLLSGETSDSLSISQVSASDSGPYHVSIQNSDFPDLTLETQPKHVRIYNPPTENAQYSDSTGNRINIEIPAEASDSIKSAIEETLKRFGSIKLDSCLCNTLEVWSLPDTITETLPNGDIRQYVGDEESIAHAKKKTEVETGNDTIKVDWDYAGIEEPTPPLGEENSPYRADFEGTLELNHEVVVAVIDYGVDSTHPSIQPFVRLANDSENYECENTNGQGYAFTPHDPNSNPWTDSLTHGTHISGIITQLIPNLPVKLMSLKIGTPGRRGRVFELACALKYAIDHGAQVINLSVGYQGLRSELLNKLLKETEEAGIIVVASAGNSTADNDIIPHWPSNLNLSNTISVAAIDPVLYRDLAPFSNYGDSTVLLAAPGVNIFSSIPGGMYEPKSGTSIAAACVTAVVTAILADDNTLSANSVKELLTSEGLYWETEPALAGKVISGGKLNLKVENCNRVPQVEPDRISMTVGQEITFNPGTNDCKSSEAIISLNDNLNIRWGHMEFEPTTGNINYLALGVGIDSLTYEVCGTDSCVQENVYIEVLGSPCILPSIPRPDNLEVVVGDTLSIVPAEDQCGPETYLPYLVDGAYGGNMWVDPVEKRIVYVPNEPSLDVIYYQMCGIENCHRVLIRAIDREERMGRSRDVNELSIQEPTLFYPNPANEKISVAFDVLNRSSVQFQIQDLMGRTLLSSNAQTLSAGRHEIDLNINDLKAGIYLAQIKIGDHTKTQKIMVVK